LLEKFREKELPLNILVNNAGTMYGRFELTKDGIEKHFQTNHLSHFLLTVSLFDILEKSQPSRVVVLSSLAHTMSYNTGILEDVNDSNLYSEFKAYGQSKLCNILFANKLNSKISADKQIYVNSVHPGYVQSELQRNVYEQWNGFFSWLARLGSKLFALTTIQGTVTSLYVATSPEIETKNLRGQYFVPLAKLSATNAAGKDQKLADKVWEVSEKMLKEKLGNRYQPKI